MKDIEKENTNSFNLSMNGLRDLRDAYNTDDGNVVEDEAAIDEIALQIEQMKQEKERVLKFWEGEVTGTILNFLKYVIINVNNDNYTVVVVVVLV